MAGGAYAVVDIVWLALLGPIHIPVLIFFFLKRHSAIFKNGCSIELSMMLIVAFWFAATWKLLCSLLDLECLYDQVFSNFSYFVIVVLYTQRALRLLFRAEIQNKLESFRKLPRLEQTTKALESGPGGWYFRHRGLIRNSNSVPLLILSFVFWIGLNFAVGASATQDCSQTTLLNYLNYVFDVVLVPIVVLIACKLRRHPNDAFNLKRDLAWIGISAILITILSVALLQIVPAKTQEEVVFVNAMFSVATMLWLLGFSGFKMVNILRQFEHKGVGGDLKSLENLLKHQKGYDSFLAYMRTEFNGENVLFWQAIQDFRAKHLGHLNFAVAFADAEDIMKNYIVTMSPMELNIDTFLRAELIQTFEGYRELKKKMDLEKGPVEEPTPRRSTLLGRKTSQTTHHKKLEEKEKERDKEGSSISMSIDEGTTPRAKKLNSPVDEKTATEQLKIVTMFDNVQQVIYDLMKADPFRRYLSSKLYAEFKASEPPSKGEHSHSNRSSTSKSTVAERVIALIARKPTVQTSSTAGSLEPNAAGGSSAETPSQEPQSREDGHHSRASRTSIDPENPPVRLD